MFEDLQEFVDAREVVQNVSDQYAAQEMREFLHDSL